VSNNADVMTNTIAYFVSAVCAAAIVNANAIHKGRTRTRACADSYALRMYIHVHRRFVYVYTCAPVLQVART
jgi:hypothetical protein